MGIEDLENTAERYRKYINSDKQAEIYTFMKNTIYLLKDLITDLQQFNEEQGRLEKRIKKIEQTKTYFPMTAETTGYY